MGALGLSVAVGLELLGTVGLIVLAARVYERAILRIGAPVRLRGLLGDEPQGREPTPRVPSAGRHLRSGVAVLLAGAALVLIDGAGIVEIVLVVVGVVLVGLHRWGGRRPALGADRPRPRSAGGDLGRLRALGGPLLMRAARRCDPRNRPIARARAVPP